MTKTNTFIVTGASGGLGKRFAAVVGQLPGCRVVPISRQPKPESWKGPWIVADVSEEPAAKDAIRQAHKLIAGEEYPILFNNAGEYISKPIGDIDAPLLLRSFQANFLTAFNATKAFCSTFSKGRVAMIIGANALTPAAKSAAYATIKLAVKRLADSFRVEYADRDFQFCVISAGSINTWSDEHIHGTSDPDEFSRELARNLCTETFCVQELRAMPL